MYDSEMTWGKITLLLFIKVLKFILNISLKLIIFFYPVSGVNKDDDRYGPDYNTPEGEQYYKDLEGLN